MHHRNKQDEKRVRTPYFSMVADFVQTIEIGKMHKSSYHDHVHSFSTSKCSTKIKEPKKDFKAKIYDKF